MKKKKLFTLAFVPMCIGIVATTPIVLTSCAKQASWTIDYGELTPSEPNPRPSVGEEVGYVYLDNDTNDNTDDRLKNKVLEGTKSYIISHNKSYNFTNDFSLQLDRPRVLTVADPASGFVDSNNPLIVYYIKSTIKAINTNKYTKGTEEKYLYVTIKGQSVKVAYEYEGLVNQLELAFAGTNDSSVTQDLDSCIPVCDVKVNDSDLYSGASNIITGLNSLGIRILNSKANPSDSLYWVSGETIPSGLSLSDSYTYNEIKVKNVTFNSSITLAQLNKFFYGCVMDSTSVDSHAFSNYGNTLNSTLYLDLVSQVQGDIARGCDLVVNSSSDITGFTESAKNNKKFLYIELVDSMHNRCVSNEAFSEDTSIENVFIGGDIKLIDPGYASFDNAFLNCDKLKKLTINLPKLKEICPSSFHFFCFGCSSLSEITIKLDSLTKMGYDSFSCAFGDDTSLISANLSFKNLNTADSSCFNMFFQNCETLSKVTLDISNLENVGDGAFYDFFFCCNSLAVSNIQPDTDFTSFSTKANIYDMFDYIGKLNTTDVNNDCLSNTTYYLYEKV